MDVADKLRGAFSEKYPMAHFRSIGVDEGLSKFFIVLLDDCEHRFEVAPRVYAEAKRLVPDLPTATGFRPWQPETEPGPGCIGERHRDCKEEYWRHMADELMRERREPLR